MVPFLLELYKEPCVEEKSSAPAVAHAQQAVQTFSFGKRGGLHMAQISVNNLSIMMEVLIMCLKMFHFPLIQAGSLDLLAGTAKEKPPF